MIPAGDVHGVIPGQQALEVRIKLCVAISSASEILQFKTVLLFLNSIFLPYLLVFPIAAMGNINRHNALVISLQLNKSLHPCVLPSTFQR